jgi:deoxyribodipyrimidine photo-lyase
MNTSRIKVIQEVNSNNQNKIIYWMQSAQRIHYNHALNYAIELANKDSSELQVIFNIIPSYKDANRRHYIFMLEGIKELKRTFLELNIPFKTTFGLPDETISKNLNDGDVLILDKAYLKQPRQWRNALYQRIKGKNTIIEIDTELIVPVEHASSKMEYGAYTIRPKLHKLFDAFNDHDMLPSYTGPYQKLTSDVELNDLNAFVETLTIDQSVIETSLFKGGYQEAAQRLQTFIQFKAKDYLERNAPGHRIYILVKSHHLKSYTLFCMLKKKGRLIKRLLMAFLNKCL